MFNKIKKYALNCLILILGYQQIQSMETVIDIDQLKQEKLDKKNKNLWPQKSFLKKYPKVSFLERFPAGPWKEIAKYLNKSSHAYKYIMSQINDENTLNPISAQIAWDLTKKLTNQAENFNQWLKLEKQALNNVTLQASNKIVKKYDLEITENLFNQIQKDFSIYNENFKKEIENSQEANINCCDMLITKPKYNKITSWDKIIKEINNNLPIWLENIVKKLTKTKKRNSLELDEIFDYKDKLYHYDHDQFDNNIEQIKIIEKNKQQLINFLGNSNKYLSKTKLNELLVNLKQTMLLIKHISQVDKLENYLKSRYIFTLTFYNLFIPAPLVAMFFYLLISGIIEQNTTNIGMSFLCLALAGFAAAIINYPFYASYKEKSKLVFPEKEIKFIKKIKSTLAFFEGIIYLVEKRLEKLNKTGHKLEEVLITP